MNRDSQFNTGFILGALIGGAAALLLSPRSGRKNRRALSSKLDLASKKWRASNGDVTATLETLFKDNTTFDKARAYFDKTLAEAKIDLAELREKDLQNYIDDAKAYFENSDDTEYNESWIDELKAEWQAATASNKTRRTRKA